MSLLLTAEKALVRLQCFAINSFDLRINIFVFILYLCTASELLKFVLNKAKADPTIQEAYLHVQLGNDEAKNFYLHHGFVEDGIIRDYYKRIDPPDCYILKMKLRDA